MSELKRTPKDAQHFRSPKQEGKDPVKNLLAPYREQLREQRFTIVPTDLILPKIERTHIAETIFSASRIEQDLAYVNKTRLRSDDALAYRREATGDTHLEALKNYHPDPNRIRIQYTINHPEERHYRRMHGLEVQPIRRLVEAALDLVPEEDRREEGQFDLHAFRTKDTVVQGWHKDGNEETPVDWVLSYVVSRSGEGAATQIARDANGNEFIHEREVKEGELIMHKDSDYYHNVTALTGTPGTPTPQRDALIMTIRPRLE